MVFYRKYRPQKISELDTAQVRDRLSAILSAKEIPHAFLFTGPKGLGKTSSARILAKAINCERRSGKDTEPCNECDACISITNGSNIDVLEIDAASNRGIDEIRDLREKIKYSPVTLKKKIYIIDEVHMLTNDAFNALLKTLEEPPDHAVFILCTTEIEKVPPTIVSRTFHVQFSKPTEEEVIRSLTRIVEGEKLDVEPEVLKEVFKLSEGSFRDAAKTLEDLSISAQGKITTDVLEKTYKSGTLDTETKRLIEFLTTKQANEALKLIDNLAQNGTDFKIFTERLAAYLHQLLLASVGLVKNEGSKKIELGEVKKLLDLVNASYRDIKFSVLPQIPLELVVVKYCVGENTPAIQINAEVVKQKIVEPVKVEERPEPVKEIKEEVEVEQVVEEEKIEEEKPTESNGSHHGVLFNANKPEDFLHEFLLRLKHDNHSVAGVLRGCKLVNISQTEVTFETRFKFHRDRLSEAKTSFIMDKRASEILAENVHVVVNLIEK